MPNLDYGIFAKSGALATHEVTGDPHPQYATDSDLSDHEAAGNPHPQYATDTDLTTHAGTPHGGVHPDLATHTGLGLAADNHTHPGGNHPDLAEHQTLGLVTSAHLHDGTYAPAHAHPYSSDTHNHTGVYEPTHAHPYAATSHAHLDADIPAGIARDSEVATAVSDHAALADPHTGYVREADANYIDLTDGGATTLHSHAGGSGMTLMKTTSDQIINGTGFVNITGLTFPVVANTDYAFDFYITIRAATTATGWRVSVNGPAGVVDYMRKYQTVANSDVVGVATWLEGHAVAFDTMTVLATSIAANVDLHARITGRFKCGGAGGTFAARVASEAANNEIVVQKGSWGTAW